MRKANCLRPASASSSLASPLQLSRLHQMCAGRHSLHYTLSHVRVPLHQPPTHVHTQRRTPSFLATHMHTNRSDRHIKNLHRQTKLYMSTLAHVSVDTDTRADTRPEPKEEAVLVACGSFNPVTLLHLRIFEDAKNYLQVREKRFSIRQGLLSPVHDSYPKKGLVPSHHR